MYLLSTYRLYRFERQPSGLPQGKHETFFYYSISSPTENSTVRIF